MSRGEKSVIGYMLVKIENSKFIECKNKIAIN